MKKLRLLLLDANVVIKLFELGLWDVVVERCDVLLAGTVADIEADYYDTGTEHRQIMLGSYIAERRVTKVDVEPSRVKAFIDRFDPTYLEKLDPGESESLAYLDASADPCLICSADKIVFRVLGRIRRSDQGRSLEEVLQQIGHGRPLVWQYSKAFREKYTAEGGRDAVQGFGLER